MLAGDDGVDQMRAIAIAAYGGPEQLKPQALPRPKPGRGELLLRVVAAGVNPIDCELRSGGLADAFDCRFPLVPGWDAAGVVEELGEGATGFRKGDRVFTSTRRDPLQWGCYAEYVAAPEAHVARMPGKLLFEEAAAVPLAALTARQCLDRAGRSLDGARVLIHGAAGGVGHFAVQLAARAGAHVIGTSTVARHPFLLSLGAAAGVDYATQPIETSVRRDSPDGVDLVIDTVGGEALALSYALTRSGGRIVSIVDRPDVELARQHGIEAESLLSQPNGEQLAELARMIDGGRLKVHVQKIFRLGHVAEAHRLLEQRHVQGKLVLNL